MDVTRVQGTVTVDSELAAAAALADAASNPTTATVGAAGPMWNGATWDRLRGLTLDGINTTQRYTMWADSLADGISTGWTQSTANGGTVTTSGGEGLLKTSTATNGSSQIVGPTLAYYPGHTAWMNSAVRFGDTGTAGDIRRVGMFTVSGTTPQEGFYYELSGTTLNAVVVKAGTPTAVASGSWSLNSTAPFTIDTNYHSFEIRYTANSVKFLIDNIVRHEVSGTTTSLTTSLSLPIAATNVKTSGATDITFAIRNIGAGAFGGPGGIQAEDMPHFDGDRGMFILGVRQDTPTSTSGTTGDYNALSTGARGELWAGLVGHNTTTRISIATTALTTATTLYTAGDVLDTEFSIANAVRVSGGRGVIEKVVAIDKSNNKAASLVELWLFRSASTPAANNAASSWADADMDNHEGVIQLPSFTTGDSALNRAVTWIGAHPFECAATTLFVVPVTRTTHTAHFNAATDLVFKFQIRYE